MTVRLNHTIVAARDADASARFLAEVLAEDSCPWVRQQATQAMGALGSDAVDELVTVLRGDEDPTVRGMAAWSLGGIGDANAVAALFTAAEDGELPSATRAMVAQALGRAFRREEPRLPELRFQTNDLLLPDITAWAFVQEL